MLDILKQGEVNDIDIANGKARVISQIEITKFQIG